MTTARDLARAVRRSEALLVDLWWELGAQGPTVASEMTGPEDRARARYLVPLARTLEGALDGSEEHRAVYLDERLRYGSLEEVQAVLGTETRRIAELLADMVEPADTIALLDELHRPLLHPEQPRRSILFLGDCLFVELRAFLVPEMSRRGLPIAANQVFFSTNQALDVRDSATLAAIREHKPDVIAISLFTFEGVPMYTAAMRAAASPLARPDLGLARGMVQLVADEIERIRTASDATIIVHAPSGLLLDPARRRLPDPFPTHSRAQKRMLDEIRTGLAELVEGTTNTVLLDEAAEVARSSSSLRAAGRSLFPTSQVPTGYAHTSRLGRILAGSHAEVIEAHGLLGRAKALFVDFDNTLWKGVMGEGEVVHDLEMQRTLKQLREAGVLLVALSKNDESAIRWDEMLLTPEDFVLTKINWRPKPDNAAEAIHELDLAPNAFVLLDDNPVERALVCEQVEGVQAMDPADPATLRMLKLWFELPSTRQTAEAAHRTEMYREAAQRRQSLSGGHDLASMMASLGLHCEFREATRADTERLLELIQRTNQFNTTTRRRSAAEVAELLDDERHGVRVASLGDRFGELGVVGVTVFDREQACFDSVIMSCRAMGFGLESTMLRATLDAELARGLEGGVVGLFSPTDRNGPAAQLFGSNGFRDEGEGRWVLDDPRTGPVTPDWMELTTR